MHPEEILAASSSQITANNAGTLDLEGLPLYIDVEHIDEYQNEIYALIRKHGLGTSDSSILLGVNPYETLEELIQSKVRPYLTQEEKEIGEKDAVKRGRDCEPIIIDKHSKLMRRRIIKPTDMYVHKDYPWIKFNFDGVIDKPKGVDQYIPDEIKTISMYGMKHWDTTKAYFSEKYGLRDVPENYSKLDVSIQNKASMYGVPPYYYTQLQQQILGLNAPFGYLTILFDKTWELHSYLIWRDEKTINELILQGYKAWQRICTLANDENYAVVPKELLEQKGTENDNSRTEDNSTSPSSGLWL